MLDEVTKQVIDTLLQQRKQIMEAAAREAARIDTVVDRLRSADGNHPLPAEPSRADLVLLVRPDEWKGWKIADALRAYLNKKNPPTAHVEPECVQALLRGGVNLGKPERHAQNIRISIRANPTRFKYSRKSDIVELLREES